MSRMMATPPAGMMIAIRCCFAGACARAGRVAAARNRPVMKSRRLVKPTFPGFRAVAGVGLYLGGVLGKRQIAFHVGQDKRVGKDRRFLRHGE